MAMDTGSMTVDYIVFVLFILANTMVAVYSKYMGPKEKTKADYVFGAVGTVSMGALMLSIVRGVLGVRSFLGFPSEFYYMGTSMYETLYGMLLAYPIVSYVFIPVYFSLGITSVYQYLDMRFKSRLVRWLASGTFIIRSLLNVGITVFTPCIALKTIIGLPYWASIASITAISIMFILMGGLKAAILSDVVQGLTMIAISLVIILQAFVKAGGVNKVFLIGMEGGRFNFFNFNLDPSIRATTLSATLGQLFMSLSIFGCQQSFVQRYCTMKSEKTVRRALVLNMPVLFVLFSLSWIAGMGIYAVYAHCDPLTTKYINKIDEIVPFFIEDQFFYLPGMLGLFMASLFNGSFSLSVSILNSLATVTYEDFISHIPAFKNLKDSKQVTMIKFIGVIYGLIVMGIAFGVGLMSGVVESSMLLTSATSGPLLGVFLLAMLIPFANWKGAATGMIMGHTVTLWVLIGSFTINKPSQGYLPLSADQCRNDSYNYHIIKPQSLWPPSSLPSDDVVSDISTTFASVETADDILTQIYSMTYMYYCLVGCIVTVLLGCIVSLLAGTTKDDIYDEHLLHPLALKISKWFPGKPRKYTFKSSTENNNTTAKHRSSIAKENTPETSQPNGKGRPEEKYRTITTEFSSTNEKDRY